MSKKVYCIASFEAKEGKEKELLETLQALEPMTQRGHVGDGNLHYNLYPPEGKDRGVFDDIRHEISTALYDLVARYEGSFSAEHGIGRLKVADLVKYADPTRLAAMRAIKAALDPNGIMNPGAVLAPQI